MTTVKVKFRPSTVEGRPGTIVYFVTHRRVVRQITTGYKVFSHEWDDKQSRPVSAPAGERITVIQTIIRKLEENLVFLTLADVACFLIEDGVITLR